MAWRKEFIDLYSSQVHDDFVKALELKREHIPAKLYRYRSITADNIVHRLSEIIDGKLFLSHPNDVNDPFEVRSMLHSVRPGTYIQAKDVFMNLFKSKMAPDEFDKVFYGENFYEKLAKYVAEKCGPLDKVKEVEELLLWIAMNEIEKLTSYKDDLFRSMIRFACFSTSSNNLPMWHHYANGHKGICLEYDTTQIKNPYQINRLFPVCYVDKLPDITFDMIQKDRSQFSVIDLQAIHKLKDWSYESEWRLIYDVGGFYYSLEEVPKEFWNQGKEIEFIKPSRIILGTDIELRYEKVIRAHAEKLNITVVKAECTLFGMKTE